MLGDVARGRDNNLNLMRMAAATAVLVSHSFVIVTGNAELEPLVSAVGMSLGTIAVDVFFIVSGFLVTASILRSKSVRHFAMARLLRIWPALLPATFLTVFALGPLFTSLPWQDYLRSRATWQYLAKSSTLVLGVAYDLPGVFLRNPYPRTVNGSLWTLPIEIRCYFGIAAAWLVCGVAGQRREVAQRALTVICVIAAAALIVALTLRGQPPSHNLRLGYMFLTGSTLQFLKHRVPLSLAAFLGGTALLVITALVSKEAFRLVYMVHLPYMVMYLAYGLGGTIRRYNAVGDYSYGIYIYAFPVQQSIMALFPRITVSAMIAWAFAATLMLAVASWHLVESKALSKIVPAPPGGVGLAMEMSQSHRSRRGP